MKIILAQPRGFCAGVVRAIDIVERALAKHGAPVYVRHEIVHNRHVVESLKAKGARFVETLKDVPAGAVTIFSAHGVSREVEDDARLRSLPTIDATCPLVTKVHNQGRGYIARGRVLVFIGHAGHPEVEGTLGQIDGEVHLVEDEDDVEKLPIAVDTPIAYITQTTLSVDDTRGVIAALVRRFTDVVGPDVRDICYATQKSTDCRARVVPGRRRHHRRWRPQQLQFQPSARDWRRGRNSELSGRRQQRNRPGMGSRRRCRRRDRWRLRA